MRLQANGEDMAEIVDISPATAEDIPTFARIMPLAMRADLSSTCLFPNQTYDLSPLEAMVLGEYQLAFSKPNFHAFKARSKETGQIVAYALVRTDIIGEEQQHSASPPMQKAPQGINQKFAMVYFGSLKQKEKQHMAGQKYAVWNSLMVHPAFQRKGIGSELLRHGIETLHLDELPVWLTTQMRGRNLYLKFGWEDVDHVDIDLSEYAGRFNGYGLHRSPCMVRPPGGKSTYALA